MPDRTTALVALRLHWKRIGLCVALGVGGLLLARPTGATTVLETPFPALVQNAEVITVGTVTAIESEWDAEQEAPLTLVTFSDLTVVKGDANVAKGAAGQTELTLQFLGGPTPDGLVLQIAGTPQFQLHERAVVFVTGNETNAVPLVGMWQGVYRVVFDPERNIETIANHAGQPVMALPMTQTQGGIVHDEALHFDTHSQSEGEEAAPSEAMPLETFLQRIEQAVQDGQPESQ